MTRGGPQAWRLGMGLTALQRKKQACYKKGSMTVGPGQTFLDKGPKQRNMDMRFGTWNIRSFIWWTP
jgi:hypothetical protein